MRRKHKEQLLLKNIPETSSVYSEKTDSGKYIDVNINRKKAADLGSLLHKDIELFYNDINTKNDSIEFNFTAPVTYEEFLTKKISAEFTDPTNIYLTKEIIDMIGAMGESYTWPEPLDISSIRRFTQGVFETKSRYVDIDYAQKSLIGSLIAPPAYVIRPPFGFGDKGMLGESAIPVFTVPNTTVAVNGGNESEWYKVVKEGDTLTQQARVIDIYEKKGAKRSLIPVVSETIFINQDSEVVALSKQINIRMP